MTPGWATVGNAARHYYNDNGMSLCGRRGYFTGPLDADQGPGKKDCKHCSTWVHVLNDPHDPLPHLNYSKYGSWQRTTRGGGFKPRPGYCDDMLCYDKLKKIGRI